MKKRKEPSSFAGYWFARRVLLSIFPIPLFVGCGAPGEPQPPSPPIPVAITDLSVRQQGNGARLIFTLPDRTTGGDRLSEPPATEIFRGAVRADGKPDGKSFRQVYTIPGALADTYAVQGKIQFTDPVAAGELLARPGMLLAYRVRTRASKKKDSADSNTVIAKMYPVAEKISGLNATVTQNAIELRWPVPALVPTANGETLAAYHVYRGELEAGASIPPTDDLSQVKWKNPPLLLAPAQSNSYSDTFFEFGKTYLYLVRSVTIADGSPIESDDSVPVMVTPWDTFPPATPQNVVAAVLPSTTEARVVDLLWSINVEPDLAGYRIYRSEKAGEPGPLLQKDLLLTPAFQDSTVELGRRYWYSVTAVDRAGNESQASQPVLADVTQPSP